MKINFLIIFFLQFILTGNLKSQVSLGVKFGANQSTALRICESEGCLNFDYKYITGEILGFYSTILIKEKFKIRPELFYVVKGFDSRPTYSARHFLGYVTLPILLEYDLASNISVLAGPEFAYKASHFHLSDNSFMDLTSVFRKYKFDIGYSIGGRVKLGENWSVDTRFVQGIIKSRTATFFRNRSFYLSLNRRLNFENKSE